MHCKTAEKDPLIGQVRRNCDISDAKHAGLYSICGLALRLRDLFKWENHLDPWVEKGSAEVLGWIGLKEELWDHLQGQEYQRLSINGKSFDPFDTHGINDFLMPQGMLYGGGYAQYLKPTFFLATIQNKMNIDNLDVFVLGQELARDLLTLPALSQNNQVLFRKNSARLYFWDQLFYIKKSGLHFLGYALEKCGIDKRDPNFLRKNMDHLLDCYQFTYIYHEIGEIKDDDFDRKIWREIIASYPQSIVEYFARTIKDLLADTNKYGTLQHIINERKDISLSLYAAFFDGLARRIFPELRKNFLDFCKSGNWNEIKKAVTIGYDRARQCKDDLLSLYHEGLDQEDKQRVETKTRAYLSNFS
ncbi:MAG: hypothetical protein R6U27_08470 [Desulfobacterales bacterium]